MGFHPTVKMPVQEVTTEFLRVLAQPTRLKILECLKRGKMYSRNRPAINGEQSNISRHISLMQKNHIVTTRKDGVRVMVR